MTIGRVFALFHGMAEYVKLTNPWGGGEETGTAGRNSQEPIDDLPEGQIQGHLVEKGFVGSVQHYDKLDDLPDGLRTEVLDLMELI